MYSRKRFNAPNGSILTLCILVLSVALVQRAIGQSSQAGAPQLVVVVDAGHSLIPANMVAAAAMREALVANSLRPLAFEVESLDVMDRLGLTPQQEARAVDRLLEKYSSTLPDLVIVVSSVALDFVDRHRATIWPGAPVVYYGVSARRIAGRQFDARIGGLTLDLDVAGTLSLAMQMQPDAADVIYVSGAAPYDAVFEPLFDDAIAAYPQRFQITKLIGLPLASLRDRLARVPSDSIVFYTSMFHDHAGRKYTPADVASALSESSAAPVYGLFGFGNGILGGTISEFEEHGKLAGLLAAHVLNRDGAAATEPIPRIAVPSVCKVDARRLTHWGLDKALVPANCGVMLAKAPLWTEHASVRLLAIAAFVALLGMSLVLRRQARHRNAAEQETDRIRGEVVHATRLALVGEISASIAHEVTQPLSAIRNNADAAEMLLERDSPSLPQIKEILADIRRDDVRAHGIVTRLKTLLKKGELNMDSVDLTELTLGTLSLIEGEARKRGVIVESSVESALPEVRGDPVHLQQVLLNLFINALDAMEAVPQNSRILRVRARTDGVCAVCISVHDSGNGISADSLPRLFDSFFTTKHNGMGLGLSVAKTIVDAHGGTLTAVSVASGGAEFQLKLPIGAAET